MREIEGAAPHSVEARSSRRRYVFFASLVWLIWLLYLVPVTASFFASHPSPLRVFGTFAGAAAFVALYAWTAWHSAYTVVGPSPLVDTESPLELWLPILAMLTLSLVLTAVNGSGWGVLFIYTCAAGGGRLPARQALGLLASVMLFALAYGWGTHRPTSITLADLFTIGFAGACTIAMVFAVSTSRRWREEREELARFASVTEERLRIARDLHDLLGHSLSLIALKSDLAQQLIPIAPERAVAEVADIERTAREALHEVRETVAGYRRPTLAAELHEARSMLAAASIVYEAQIAEGAVESLPREAEAALSWAVREGVTNVIRHSRARRCELRLEPLDGEVLLEIGDDGVGGQSTDVAHAHGNGLRGLGERVAAAGGHYTAGPRAEGSGYSLRVWVPVAGGRPRTASSLDGTARDSDARAVWESEEGAARGAQGASAGVPASTRERGDGA